MKLKILAISDTHLGEETSLLSYPIGVQHLWKVLRQTFSDNPEETFDVEEMILLGDIPDRALASTSQIVVHTSALIRALGSAANIKRAVYVPGNHDHTLWTNYLRGKRSSSEEKICGSTKPSGEFIIKDGTRCDDMKYKPWAEELLSIFFGYPFGSAMRNIRDTDFVIANPLYVKAHGDRSYVFTHGTHFRGEVCLPAIIKMAADYAELDFLFGGIDIQSDCNVTKATDLESLEEVVAPFVDSLWVSSKNIPASKSDDFWYLITMMRAKLSGPLEGRKMRKVTEYSKLFSWDDLQQPSSRDRIWNISSEDDSIQRWKKYFLPHMRTSLEQNDLLRSDITFVYGDTHHGGWGAIPANEKVPERIRIYNCGGWSMHGDENYHPACHLFAVDENEQEYLLDVSFIPKGEENNYLKVGKDSLLKYAADDAENRKPSIKLSIIEKLLS